MQRADTIRALGNPVIQTPNLDRLVREGTAFTSAYSPSPVCVPARCCLHYGLYPQRTGLYDNGPMMDDNGASYPAVLGRHGYDTAAVGKCHFTPDPHGLRGFGRRWKQEEGVRDYDRDDYRVWLREQGLDPCEPHGTRGEMYYIPQVSLLDEEHHPTRWVADRTIEQIASGAGQDRPWCLFSSYIHPHPPLAPPRPWHKLYRAPTLPLPHVPDRFEALWTHINRHQNRYKYRDQGIDRNLLRNIKAYYYATISFVDHQVGRVLAALERTGQLDRTLIVFASDHGEYLGDYHCFGKRSMHDASARVPLVVRHPARFPAGARCAAPVSLVDLMPTFLRAAGIETGEFDLDGEDLSRVAAGDSERDVVFSQHGHGQKAIYLVVSERWKYFYSAGDHREVLIDRLEDPLESRNKAGITLYARVRNAMKQRLLGYLREVGHEEAYELRDGSLDWRPYPRLEREDLERDPDAALLFQDEPASLFGERDGFRGPEHTLSPSPPNPHP
jgi:arylsulfatase A-like enzyme